MQNYLDIKTILILTAMSGGMVGCQSNLMVSRSTKSPTKPQTSKCERMLEIAQRFEQQGLYDQARHVYKLIPQDSKCYSQAKQELANLGTAQQPAKINIASQNNIKRIPQAVVPNHNVQSNTPAKPELLVKNIIETPVSVDAQLDGTTEVQEILHSAEQSDSQKQVMLHPVPLTLPKCDQSDCEQSSECPSCFADPLIVAQDSEITSCPSCRPLVSDDQGNHQTPAKMDVAVDPSLESITPVPEIEELFKNPLQIDLINQKLINYKKLLVESTITPCSWREIHELGADAAPLLRDIEQFMVKGTMEQQLHAAFTIYMITGSLEPGFSHFQQGLRSTNAGEVGLAAFYLGEIGTQAKVLHKELDGLVANGNSQVRINAAEALIKIYGPLPEYQLALCQAAEDEHCTTRVLAIVGLANAGMELDPHVAESLYYLISDQDQDVAAQSMMTLALLRPVEPRFKELVLKILNDESHTLHDTAQVAWKCIQDQYVTQSQPE